MSHSKSLRCIQVAFVLCFIFIVFLFDIAKGAEFQFNGLTITLDDQTGNLVRLADPDVGVFLEAPAESAGFIDLAHKSGGSTQRVTTQNSPAKISQSDENTVTIAWENLAYENKEKVDGSIRAQIDIKRADDDRSVTIECTITNHTTTDIPQILFPDLWGLTGDSTLRTMQDKIDPFKKYPDVDNASPRYISGGNWRNVKLFLRWLYFGNYQGGLSVFQKKWQTIDPMRIAAYLQKADADPDHPRLCIEHLTTIKPGQTWKSGEFVFTAHKGGWAKGIEVFRDYVRQVNPPRYVPKQIREDIGYRTIWMIERTETDPAMADFHFSDIPAVAKESAEHGLHEMVIWFWNNRPNWMPLDVREELGTRQEYIDGVKAARDMGVNVAPFYTVCIIRPSIAKERYGLDLEAKTNWTYHEEFVPVFQPYYMQELEHINQHPLVSLGAYIPFKNPAWQKDIFNTFKEWIDAGVPSISWDVFRSNECDENGPVLVQLIQKVRNYARKQYPDSTFSAELISLYRSHGGGSPEWDNRVLDYTWIWAHDYIFETEPYFSVMSTPRINMIVNTSPLQARKAFTAGMFLNVMPKKPDRPNGSAMIADYPLLSAALKEVAALRKQFLPYFTEGAAMGDSALSKASAGFVRAYQQPNKLLFIALNDSESAQPITINSDLTLWLSDHPACQVNYYDSKGQLLQTDYCQSPAEFSAKTRELAPAELALYEVVAIDDLGDYVQTYELNDWQIQLDAKSGSIVKLSHPEAGVVINTTPKEASLIDLAYPITEYPPLRLAARFSEGRVERSDDGITIVYDRLGKSRNHFSVAPIDISAKVMIRAAEDGKSLLFSAAVSNQTDLPIPQILFPDLMGVKPMGDRENTQLSCFGKTVYPFRGSVFNPESGKFYAAGAPWRTYNSDNKNDSVKFVAGSKQLEISGPVMAEQETEQETPVLMTNRKEADDLYFRLCWQYQDMIEPGQTWHSGEFKITPGE